MATRSIADRFWARVDKASHPGGCWVWTGYKIVTGYGYTGTSLAHRWAWEERHGTIAGNLYCCHKCNNPSCVNPDHLFLGTAKDNAQDRQRKGRGGQRNQFRMTGPDAVKLLVEYMAGGKTQDALAAKYNVSTRTVNRLVRVARAG